MKKQLLFISALFFSLTVFSQSITTGDLDFGTQNISLNATVNTSTNIVTMTITGPQTRWFGIGFDATFMNGTYAIIFKENNGTIEERMLVGHSKGNLLGQELSISSDTNDGVIRTVVLTKPRNAADANAYDFPTTDGSTTNVIWGFGPSGGSFDTATFMGGHSPGGVLITFNDSGLSVEDFNNVLNAAVFYPNPSSGKINIENGREINTIAVYDMMGRVVKEINYREQSTNSIDLSDLKSGMYAVLLLGDNNLRAMKRLVIN